MARGLYRFALMTLASGEYKSTLSPLNLMPRAIF